MQQVDGELIVSPTDLTKYLACEHLTRLDLAVARGELAKPDDAIDEALQILFTRGLEHEYRYLDRLRAEGRRVVEIPDEGTLRERELATEQAMAEGADVIYQATFFDGRWRGHADFLLRRDDRPGRWAWSYDVADTKLARRMKVAALLQMGESGLAHEANCHDAPSHADVDARVLKFLGAFGGEVTKNLIERVSELVFAAIGGLTESLNLLQLFAAQIIDMFVECQRESFLRNGRWNSEL